MNIVVDKQNVNGCNGTSFSDRSILQAAVDRRRNKNVVSLVSPVMVGGDAFGNHCVSSILSS